MSVWSAAIWLKNQITTVLQDNTKWKYSNYNKTGTRKYLFKKTDMDYQPMGDMDEYTVTIRGESNIDNNPVYILGSFIPKVSGYHDISFAYMGASVYPVDLAIGTLQDYYNAVNAEIAGQNLSQTPLGVGEAITASFNKDFANAVIDDAVNVALQRMPRIKLSSYSGRDAHIYCNLTANVPVYYFACNTKTNDAKDFQIYNVQCVYYENEALY